LTAGIAPHPDELALKVCNEAFVKENPRAAVREVSSWIDGLPSLPDVQAN
jgi:hypothetical protein